MEEHFSLTTPNGTIRGMCHSPISALSEVPVLMCHGYFSANRVGPARLYVQLARHLCQNGFQVFRADVIGVGDSDGNFSDVTFESELRDIRRIRGYVQSATQKVDVALLGHSMGANLALKIAIDDPTVAALVLLAPEVRFRGGSDRLFSSDQLNELNERGWTIRKGLHVNDSFVSEIRSLRILELARIVDVPFLVVQGDQDDLYDPAGASALVRRSDVGREIRLPNADHNFLGRANRQVLFRVVEDEFKRRLKDRR